MELQDQVERGRQARDLLDNHLLAKALKASKEEIIEMWESTPARDSEAREWLFKMYQASLRFEKVLLGYIDSGKIAQKDLKEKTLAEKIRLFK